MKDRKTGGGKGRIYRAALSPDGKTIASVGPGWSVPLWDVATGKKVATLTQPGGGTDFLLFSSDGKKLLALGLRNCPNYLWDLKTKKERRVMDGLNAEGRMNYRRVAAFDPKGKPLVLVRDGPLYPPGFELWTADSTKKSAVTFQVPAYTKKRLNGPGVLAFSRDCKTIVSVDGDRMVRLWDTATGKNTAALPKLPGPAHSLAFSPDGKVLAIGSFLPMPLDAIRKQQRLLPHLQSFKRSVRLYKVSTGKVLATLTSDSGPHGFLVVFSPDGHTLAVGDGGRNITLWSLPARYAPSKSDRK